MASASSNTNHHHQEAEQHQQQELIKLLTQQFYLQFYQSTNNNPSDIATSAAMTSAQNTNTRNQSLMNTVANNQFQHHQASNAALLANYQQQQQQQQMSHFAKNDLHPLLSSGLARDPADLLNLLAAGGANPNRSQAAPATNNATNATNANLFAAPTAESLVDFTVRTRGLNPYSLVNYMNIFEALNLNMTSNQLVLSLQQQQQQQALLQAAAAAAEARRQYEIRNGLSELVGRHADSRRNPKFSSTNLADTEDNHNSDGKELLKFSINTILGRGSPDPSTPTSHLSGNLDSSLDLPSSSKLRQTVDDKLFKISSTSRERQANHHQLLQNHRSVSNLANTTGLPLHLPTVNSQQQHNLGRLLNSPPNGSTASSRQSTGSNLPSTPTNKPITSPNRNSGSQSAALSSLSNFVSEQLAPILNDSQSKHATSGGNKSFRSSTSSLDFYSKCESPAHSSSTPTMGKQKHNNGSQHRKSSSMEPEEAHGNELWGEQKGGDANKQNRSTLDLISSAAHALKSTTGASINTTLAKAPPELVQKQPAWVFCTRYSDRPSSGPRTRRAKSKDKKAKDPKANTDEKRPRTAFTSEQLEKLRQEFQDNSYLDEKRRKDLAERLCLNENQIKIWFQNKRAKMKKQNNQPNPLRGLLVAGGLYNHSTATSDCSESYANGNDHGEDDDGEEDGRDDNEISVAGGQFGTTPIAGAKKRAMSLEDQNGGLTFSNENDTGMKGSKRTKLSHNESDYESELEI